MSKVKLLFLFFIIILFPSCQSVPKAHSQDLFYMDTYINIKIYNNDEVLVKKAFKKIDNIFKEYHQLTDRYHQYDNLINVYYLNYLLDNKEPIVIDERLFKLLVLSQDYYSQTNGLFNIAIGNVVDKWLVYRKKGEGVPTIDELKNSGSIKIDDIRLEENNTFSKRNNVSIDLGGIAKGYVTELVGNYLEGLGIDAYLINAGGNVKVGNHYHFNQYKIGLENPTLTNDIYQIIKVVNKSVVTSGNYERYYEYEGLKYHHLIDPYTLFPPYYMNSVTVISNNSTLGDVLATTLFLMPIDEGLVYVDSLPDIEAIWYGIDNKMTYSKGFDQYE